MVVNLITFIPTGEIYVSGNGPKAKHPLSRAIGVYQIRCLKTDNLYLGASRKLANRMSQHRAMLRMDKHPSVKFQEQWNRHGEHNFVFEVLELCSLLRLKTRESYWMRKKEKDLLNFYHNNHGYTREFDLETRLKLSRLAKLRHKAGRLGRQTWRCA